MKRNAVKTGLLDQRNRATQSRRDKKINIASQESKNELITWLKKSKISESELNNIIYTEYLRDTQHIDIVAEERLRHLAIYLEDEALSLQGTLGWYSLKRLYDYALELNHENENVWLSMGIFACEMADNQQNEKSKKTIFSAAEHAILNAMNVRENWSKAFYTLGYVYYLQDKKKEALYAFEQALGFENEDMVHSWAQLYKAHCFQDMQKWSNALEAYELVDLSAFKGLRSWRVDVLHEQIAFCKYKLGQHKEALQMLINILARYEAEPKVAMYAMSSSLWDLAKAISPEFLNHVKSIDAKAYNKLYT